MAPRRETAAVRRFRKEINICVKTITKTITKSLTKSITEAVEKLVTHIVEAMTRTGRKGKRLPPGRPRRRSPPKQTARPSLPNETPRVRPSNKTARPGPQNEMVSPQDEVASPQDEMASPQDEMASPQDEMASPQDEMASPQDEMASPQDEIPQNDIPWPNPHDDTPSPGPAGHDPTPPRRNRATDAESPGPLSARTLRLRKNVDYSDRNGGRNVKSRSAIATPKAKQAKKSEQSLNQSYDIMDDGDAMGGVDEPMAEDDRCINFQRSVGVYAMSDRITIPLEFVTVKPLLRTAYKECPRKLELVEAGNCKLGENCYNELKSFGGRLAVKLHESEGVLDMVKEKLDHLHFTADEEGVFHQPEERN